MRCTYVNVRRNDVAENANLKGEKNRFQWEWMSRHVVIRRDQKKRQLRQGVRALRETWWEAVKKEMKKKKTKKKKNKKKRTDFRTRKRRADFDERRDLVDFADVIRRRGCRAPRKKKKKRRRKTTVRKKATKNKKKGVYFLVLPELLLFFIFQKLMSLCIRKWKSIFFYFKLQ